LVLRQGAVCGRGRDGRVREGRERDRGEGKGGEGQGGREEETGKLEQGCQMAKAIPVWPGGTGNTSTLCHSLPIIQHLQKMSQALLIHRIINMYSIKQQLVQCSLRILVTAHMLLMTI